MAELVDESGVTVFKGTIKGGGSLPPEWTVTDGALTIAPTSTSPNSLEIDAPPNALADDTYLLIVKDENGVTLFRVEPDGFIRITAPTGSNGAGLYMEGDNANVATPGQIVLDPGRDGVSAEVVLTPPTGQPFKLVIRDANGAIVHQLASTTLGFFGATPIAQQTGVAVDAAAIHAALVALGLITA